MVAAGIVGAMVGINGGSSLPPRPSLVATMTMAITAPKTTKLVETQTHNDEDDHESLCRRRRLPVVGAVASCSGNSARAVETTDPSRPASRPRTLESNDDLPGAAKAKDEATSDLSSGMVRKKRISDVGVVMVWYGDKFHYNWRRD